MNKNQEEKKVVLPLVAVTCSSHRSCCDYGNDCPATFKILNKKLVFNNCGCRA